MGGIGDIPLVPKRASAVHILVHMVHNLPEKVICD